MLRLLCLIILCCSLTAVDTVDLGAPYGHGILIEEIDCGVKPNPENFKEYPENSSRIEKILGQTMRVLPNDQDHMRYMAYRLGRGKGLKAHAAYLVTVTYPEDQPRSMYMLNRGNETGMGFATGSAVADCLKGRYVNNSPESINYPLSGKLEEWQMFFHLHERFPKFESLRGIKTERTEKPEDGFWFVIAQTKNSNAPLSKGAAIGKIRLYEIPEVKNVKINYPADGLPRRYTFCREEMADGVVGVPHGKDTPEMRGMDDPIDWFENKAKYMKFLGMNTYAKDLLEFGHCQGWETHPEKGNNEWYYQSSRPKTWQNILSRLAKYDLYVLPMYEYGGSTGPNSYGKEHDFLSLNGNKEYTHIKWLEKNSHADVTDPRCLAELKKIFDLTILRHKEKVPFIGAWLRPRPMQMPMNFSDTTLKRFSDAHKRSTAYTRKDLQNDKALLNKYYTWWFKQRQELNNALSTYLNKELGKSVDVLYTSDSNEPGQGLPNQSLVTDNPDVWSDIMRNREKPHFIRSYADVVANNLHGQACASPTFTWGQYEMHHATPWADPENYKEQAGSLQTLTYHRLYSVSNPQTFDQYRGKSGLAIVRHYSLNENEMEAKLGYFVCDVERTRSHCMLMEARALAYGDPRYIGYLISNTLTRGFPQYVQNFNAAFLSLPAIPSTINTTMVKDKDIVVREYKTDEHGTYYAIINVSLADKKHVEIQVPNGVVKNAATDKVLRFNDNTLLANLYSGQVVTLHIK